MLFEVGSSHSQSPPTNHLVYNLRSFLDLDGTLSSTQRPPGEERRGPKSGRDYCIGSRMTRCDREEDSFFYWGIWEPLTARWRYIPSFFPITDLPAYSDTLGTWEKCHCNQIVTVSRVSLLTNQSFGTCSKCHCKRAVTVNSVTVTGDIFSG